MSKYEKCRICNKEMAPSYSCSHYAILNKKTGRITTRVPCGMEKSREIIFGQKCGTCQTGYGMFHHVGCPYEECPFCGKHLVSCDCKTEVRKRLW